MKGNIILKAMNGIDEDLLEESIHHKKKSYLLTSSAVAASLILLIGVSYLINKAYVKNEIIDTISDKEKVSKVLIDDKEKSHLTFNKVDSALEASIDIEGYFYHDLTSEQIKQVVPILYDKYEVSGTVDYSSKDGESEVWAVNMYWDSNGSAANLTVSPKKIPMCYVIKGKEKLSNIAGVDLIAGIFGRGQRVTYYADYQIEDVYYRLEYYGKSGEENVFSDILVDIIKGGKADLSIFENPTVPELMEKELTLQEAYKEEDFGKYLLYVPSEYIFNSSARVIDQHSNYLYASWSHDYSDVNIFVSRLGETDKERIIEDIKDTRLYDLSLYTTPRAQSVPDELREIVDNPIFKIEDLTIDIVNKRTDKVIDFSVLYPEDIIVAIRAEGLEPQYLLKELKRINE